MTAPDLEQAAAFLDRLGARHSFQTFDDSSAKRRALSRILHGTLAQHGETLAALNTEGAGVFVMVNAGNGKGRKAGNVNTVRALFVDLDGSPLEPVKSCPLPPHVVVESSPGRWHGYWLVSDCLLADFAELQKRLAQRFNGDPKVCDLPRVMRIPGFEHRKETPRVSRLLQCRDAPPYRMTVIRHKLLPDVSARTPDDPVSVPRRRSVPHCIPEGKRNATLFSLACGFVRRGHTADAVNQRLQRMNAERCQPPLCASEVDNIAANASARGSDGFAVLPHRLLDSPEWLSAAPAVHDVVLAAFRRHDGTGKPFALSHQDFAGRPGLSRPASFYRHRTRAIEQGFLIVTSEARNSQSGRRPDLFTIAPKWLHSAKYEKGSWPQLPNGKSYVDKQALADLLASRTLGDERRERAQHEPKEKAA